MALDLAAPLNRLVTLGKTISGLADEADGTVHVVVGAPDSVGPRLMMYVALADFPEVSESATQLQDVMVNYAVGWAYRVAGAEATAEASLCAAVAAWLHIMKQAVNRKLNNGAADLVEDARLVSLASARPQYTPIAGQEVRLIESLVRTKQRQTYG